jgi:4-alpha-glucanotransferase
VPELNPDHRIAGVLAPVFALRGSQDLGVGDTRALREFADWAAGRGLRVVQILPINEAGSDHSPYNILSSMALDPVTIATTPDELPDLSRSDFKRVTAKFDLDALRAGAVRYGEVKRLKRALLEAAHENFREQADEARMAAFDDFRREHDDWLPAYALYRALVSLHGESEVFSMWPPEQQSLEGAQAWVATLPDSERAWIDERAHFHGYVQWIAFSQWRAVRAHCDGIGVSLMGDVPVGVSVYSCDVWSEPHVFDLSRSCGAPPEKVFKADPFTEKWGQNWGFPLYDWFAMSKDNFAWWRRRLRAMAGMFDLIRVDHALGFFRIYSFPWRPSQNAQFLHLDEEQAKELTGGRLPGFAPRDDSTSENRERNRVHGEVLFKVMLEEIPAPRLVAEDLGTVPPYVRPTLAALDIPGFKIPQWERPHDGAPELTPGAEYPRLSLATFATHDHPPVRTFWNDWAARAQAGDAQARDDMRALLAFCGEKLDAPRPFDAEIYATTMRGLMACNSWLAIPMITDILGAEDRFNVPGAIGDENWTARLGSPISRIDAEFSTKLAVLCQILAQTGRLAE